jgi:hypothetical protein
VRWRCGSRSCRSSWCCASSCAHRRAPPSERQASRGGQAGQGDEVWLSVEACGVSASCPGGVNSRWPRSAAGRPLLSRKRKPSRSGGSEVPATTFADVAGMEAAKRELAEVGPGAAVVCLGIGGEKRASVGVGSYLILGQPRVVESAGCSGSEEVCPVGVRCRGAPATSECRWGPISSVRRWWPASRTAPSFRGWAPRCRQACC